MSVALAWLTGQEWFRKLVVVLGLLLAVLLALAGVRRSGEKAGRMIERETHRVEQAKAEERVRAVERKMEAVPRPTSGDVTARLRRGDF